jgi:uncharacterized protein YceK
MNVFRLLPVCMLLVVAPGCAAIAARERDGAGRAYAGVRDDVYYLTHPQEADKPMLQPLNVVDLPFSFLVDTVLLPYDLVK